MPTYQFVTQSAILSLVCDGPHRPPSGIHQHEYHVRVKEGNVERGTSVVSVTEEAEVDDAFSDRRRWLTLADILRPYILSDQYDTRVDITTDNIRQHLATRGYREEEIELGVAKVMWRYVRSSGKPRIAGDLISLSTGFPVSSVRGAMSYFATKGIVKLVATIGSGMWDLLRGGMEALETIIQQGQIRRFPPIGYFREDPLPPEFDQPYVFVLIPFDDEYQQLYRRVIKPHIEDVTQINCWKADENQNQLQITNQIYAQIVRAEVLVAEITTLNPNVLVEIGVALAHNKQVFIFYNKRQLSKVPFYIDKIPHHGYSDDTEYGEVLGVVRIPA